MTLHLEEHHRALNALLSLLRERGGFALAGQFMQLHPKNDWAGMRQLAAQTEASHPDIDVCDAAERLKVALDHGPLQDGWMPPESRDQSG